jgi:hypothetical protein
MKRLVMALSFLACSLTTWAEQKIEFDGYELHYIVLNSTEIPAQIADTYNLSRSGKQAFINLSVLQQTLDGYGIATSADIKARQRSLLGQTSNITLREIKEGEAIYYIGSFRIFDQETLWFDIELELKDGTRFNYSFAQKVWQE